MSKDKHGDGMVFQGLKGTQATWNMYLRNKLVLTAFVDTTADELYIHVMSIDGKIVKTSGKTWWKLDTEKTGPGEADVKVVERLASSPVMGYVYNRLPWLLAKLYVPGFHPTSPSE